MFPGGPPSLISLMVSVDVKQHLTKFRSCVKVEVAVLGSPSLISLMVSVEVKCEPVRPSGKALGW